MIDSTLDDLLGDPQLVLVLHPALEVLDLSGSRIHIRGLNDNVTITDEGGLVRQLLARLDGSAPLGEIVSELQVPPEQRHQLLEAVSQLQRRGILVREADVASSDLLLQQFDFLRRQRQRSSSLPLEGVDVAEFPSCVASVFGAGVLFGACCSSLASLGLKVSTNPPRLVVGDGKVALVCADADRRPAARTHNENLVAAKVPALYATLCEHIVRIGPFVVPGETGCLECYHRRVSSLLSHRDEDIAHTERLNAQENEARGAALLMARLAADLAASNIAKFLCGLFDYALVGFVFEMSMISGRTAIDPLARLPRCHVCGIDRHGRPPSAIRGVGMLA